MFRRNKKYYIRLLHQCFLIFKLENIFKKLKMHANYRHETQILISNYIINSLQFLPSGREHVPHCTPVWEIGVDKDTPSPSRIHPLKAPPPTVSVGRSDPRSRVRNEAKGPVVLATSVWVWSTPRVSTPSSSLKEKHTNCNYIMNNVRMIHCCLQNYECQVNNIQWIRKKKWLL